MQAATIVINHRALQHSLQCLRELVPASKLVAAVKANAYGHGLLETARMLPDTDTFGVVRLEEALRLRAGGITRPVLLLEGFFDTSDLPATLTQCLHTAVYNQGQLKAPEVVKLAEPITVWMRPDTDMYRPGVRPEQAEVFYQRLTQCESMRQSINITSHFIRVDEPECGATEKQLNILNSLCGGRLGQHSIAAPDGILLWPQSYFDWVHPGLILYGVSPLENHSIGADFGCQPVMSLISSLIAVCGHRTGGPVGCGGTWLSECDMRLGVVTMDYDDGYPRVAPSGIPVLVNGHEVPIISRVTMDVICVDLRPEMQDEAGDSATLWGKGLLVERIAEMTKISTYELITRLTLRVAMKYID